MSLWCLLGHHWLGCKCERCGRLRDTGHRWCGCKCYTCDKLRDMGHRWDRCRCNRCRKARQHEWEGDVCRHCRGVKCSSCRATGETGFTDSRTLVFSMSTCSACQGLRVTLLPDKPTISRTEQEQRLAKAQEWMKAHGRCPLFEWNHWHWYSGGMWHEGRPERLPLEIFEGLMGGRKDSGRVIYTTREEAERALADSLADLSLEI